MNPEELQAVHATLTDLVQQMGYYALTEPIRYARSNYAILDQHGFPIPGTQGLTYPPRPKPNTSRGESGYDYPTAPPPPKPPRPDYDPEAGFPQLPYANYAAPEDEITGLASQQRLGGSYDPMNTTDHILADKLDDYGDPRAEIVRRDLSYRGEGDFGTNVDDHLNEISGYPTPHGRRRNTTYHEIPGGGFSIHEYGEPDQPADSYKVLWSHGGPNDPYPATYVAAMHPHEVAGLLDHFGIPHDIQTPDQPTNNAQYTNYDDDPETGLHQLPYEDDGSIRQMMNHLQHPDSATHRMGLDDPLYGVRGPLADAMDEAGRSQEAHLLRQPNQHVMVHEGQVVPARLTTEHIENAANRLLDHVTRWSDNYYGPTNFEEVDSENVHPSELGRHIASLVGDQIGHEPDDWSMAHDNNERRSTSPVLARDPKEIYESRLDRLVNAPYEETDPEYRHFQENLSRYDDDPFGYPSLTDMRLPPATAAGSISPGSSESQEAFGSPWVRPGSFPRQAPGPMQSARYEETPIDYAAPLDDVTALASHQGTESDSYVPGHSTDSILADYLDDHEDPRAHIVRRDLSYRNARGLSGFNEGLRAHAQQIAGRPVTFRPSTGKSFHIPGGVMGYRTYSDDESNDVPAYQVFWSHGIPENAEGRNSADYAGTFSPEEAAHIFNHFGINHGIPTPEAQEPTQNALYGEMTHNQGFSPSDQGSFNPDDPIRSGEDMDASCYGFTGSGTGDDAKSSFSSRPVGYPEGDFDHEISYAQSPDPSTHDAMMHGIMSNQDASGLGPFADMLQEQDLPGAHLARQAFWNSQDPEQVSHPFRPGEWAPNHDVRLGWPQNFKEDGTDVDTTGPSQAHEMEISPTISRPFDVAGSPRGGVLTVTHGKSGYDPGSHMLHYAVPVESKEHLAHLTQDLPDAQRNAIHAYMEPHLPSDPSFGQGQQNLSRYDDGEYQDENDGAHDQPDRDYWRDRTPYSDDPTNYADNYTHQDFLNAIHTNPNESTHGLAYADWLEEKGMPYHAHMVRSHVGNMQKWNSGKYPGDEDFDPSGMSGFPHGMNFGNRNENFEVNAGGRPDSVQMQLVSPLVHDEKGNPRGGITWFHQEPNHQKAQEVVNGLVNEGAAVGGYSSLKPSSGQTEGLEGPREVREDFSQYANNPINYVSENELPHLLSQISPQAWRGWQHEQSPHFDLTPRLVAADYLDDLHGQTGNHDYARQAAILRDTRKHAYIEPGENTIEDAHQWSDAIHKQYHPNIQGYTMRPDHLEPGFQQYLDTALWSSHDHDAREPLDENHSWHDIHPSTMASMLADWKHFKATNADKLAETGTSDEDQAHDFWLSRNGHGAGFFDKPERYGDMTDHLQDAAEKHGPYDLDVGDDGMIHGYPYETHPTSQNRPTQASRYSRIDYMTTEDDFHKLLDQNPHDHQTRTILADYLDEQNDPRAAGYRALGMQGLHPWQWPGRTGYANWTHDQNLVSDLARTRPGEISYPEHSLPKDWFDLIPTRRTGDEFWRNYGHRRDAEDDAAIAFTGLPPERQQELLNPPQPTQASRYADSAWSSGGGILHEDHTNHRGIEKAFTGERYYPETYARTEYAQQLPQREQGVLSPEQAEIGLQAHAMNDLGAWGALGDHLQENGYPGAGGLLSRLGTGHPAVTIREQSIPSISPGEFHYRMVRDGSDLLHMLHVRPDESHSGYQIIHRVRPNEQQNLSRYEDFGLNWAQRDAIADWVSQPRTHLQNYPGISPVLEQDGDQRYACYADDDQQQWTDPHAPFHAAIYPELGGNPLDPMAHYVYSDFLRENGQHDEADFRQAMGDWVAKRNTKDYGLPYRPIRTWMGNNPATPWTVITDYGHSDYPKGVMHENMPVSGLNPRHRVTSFASYSDLDGALRRAFHATRQSQGGGS